eukprot:m.49470 g.49470  ORF g.49470 m.49470 type:complete len:136 (-) comp10616_c0_seq2:2766-3173(-)
MASAGSSLGKRKRDTHADEQKEQGDDLTGSEFVSFLENLNDFTPTIPAAVIQFHLMRSGLKTSDERVVKLIALATQKFVADVALDSMQHCKQRQANQQGSKRQTIKEKRHVLATTDLQAALQEHGIHVHKPPYYI